MSRISKTLPKICANKSVSITVCKHVAKDPEGSTGQEDIQEVLDENVCCVLGPHTTSLQESKATLEEEYEHTVDDEEESIHGHPQIF